MGYCARFGSSSSGQKYRTAQSAPTPNTAPLKKLIINHTIPTSLISVGEFETLERESATAFRPKPWT